VRTGHAKEKLLCVCGGGAAGGIRMLLERLFGVRLKLGNFYVNNEL